MLGEQAKNPFPVMLNLKGGRAIAMDHILGIETQALESHKTVLLHTTDGSYMFHDDVALDLARAFQLRPAAQAPGVSDQAPVPVAAKRKKG
jgi:hypothetical protein